MICRAEVLEVGGIVLECGNLDFLADEFFLLWSYSFVPPHSVFYSILGTDYRPAYGV